MASALTVFIIQIDLAKDIESCPEVVRLAKRSFITSAFDAKDGEKRLTYVKEHTGTANTVRTRYKEVEDHPDVLNMRVFTSSPNYSSSMGVLDPVFAKLDAAYGRIKRRKSNKVPDVNRVFVNNKKGARG